MRSVMISLLTSFPSFVKSSVKNQYGVWLYHTRTCPRTGMLWSRQKFRMYFASPPSFTFGTVLSPDSSRYASVAFWSSMFSGFSSFPSVSEL